MGRFKQTLRKKDGLLLSAEGKPLPAIVRLAPAVARESLLQRCPGLFAAPRCLILALSLLYRPRFRCHEAIVLSRCVRLLVFYALCSFRNL